MKGLDSKSFRQRDPKTQQGGSETIGMEALYFERA